MGKNKPVPKFEFDFYKELKLPRPVLCGLVNKITQPKGKRVLDESIGQYSYGLHNNLIQVYNNEEACFEPGLYWVMDIYKYRHELHWNHYLIIMEDDGSVYVVAEFLDCNDSTWIKKAVKTVNAYFDGKNLDPIGITQCAVDKPTKKLFNS